MISEESKKFNLHHHTILWKDRDAKNPGKGYGTDVAGKWHRYENRAKVVRKRCED
jgi:hypothetical protein